MSPGLHKFGGLVQCGPHGLRRPMGAGDPNGPMVSDDSVGSGGPMGSIDTMCCGPRAPAAQWASATSCAAHKMKQPHGLRRPSEPRWPH